MEDDKNQQTDANSEEIQSTSNKLDSEDTVVEQSSSPIKQDDDNTLEGAKPQDSEIFKNDALEKPKPTLSQRVQGIVGRVNIYLLLFILVMILAGIATFASFRANQKATNTNITGQVLSDKDLQNLKNNDTSVGDPKQTLTIASNAIFNGRVLVKDSLDVAGTIRVGSSLSLPGISVSGNSAFENVQVGSNLSVVGNAAIQGALTVQKNLSVGGSASFAGTISAPTISVDKLILNQDLQVNRHIEAGGSTPSVSSLNPGSGGGVSISGSDTSGTVSIAFGSGSGGGLARVTFANRYNQAPHVVIAPVGRQCANLTFYLDEISTSGFVIGIDNSASAGSRCSFNYIAID